MQRLRIFLATLLLSITGIAVFGARAIASPRSLASPIPPQACSTGGSGSGSSGGASYGSSGGYSGSGSGLGSGNGSGGDGTGGDNGVDNGSHVLKPARPAGR